MNMTLLNSNLLNLPFLMNYVKLEERSYIVHEMVYVPVPLPMPLPGLKKDEHK